MKPLNEQGYLAEKQNTTYKQQTSKDVKRETTKRMSKNVLLKSKTPLQARNMHIDMMLLLKAKHHCKQEICI